MAVAAIPSPKNVRKPVKRPYNCKDITGQRFERLVAIQFSHKDERSQNYWVFRCDCGSLKIIRKPDVTSGRTKSCGCYGREQSRRSKNKHSTHGMTDTR